MHIFKNFSKKEFIQDYRLKFINFSLSILKYIYKLFSIDRKYL